MSPTAASKVHQAEDTAASNRTQERHRTWLGSALGG